MIQDQSTPLSREDRDELAAAANNADRRNTPKGLIVVGGAVLLLGAALILASWFSLKGARSEWNTETGKVTRIKALSHQLQELETAASDSSNILVHDPISNMGTDIQRIATQAGVTVGVPNTSNQNTMGPNARIVLWGYDNVTDDSLEDLLSWIHQTREQIPGMRVDQILIRLTVNTNNAANGEWKLDVTFARTEKTP